MSKNYFSNANIKLSAKIVSVSLFCYMVISHSRSGNDFQKESIPLVEGSIPFNRTTCSYKAFTEGEHQKVTAYVYYDDPENSMTESRKYLFGIEFNAQMNKKFYPEWKMWVYHDIQEGSEKSRLELVCIDVMYKVTLFTL